MRSGGAKLETRSKPPNWRLIGGRRHGDEEVVRLSKKSKPGNRVYFDPGPGLRVSGVLKDFESEGMAVIEIDSEDRQLVNSKTIMKVPVTR